MIVLAKIFKNKDYVICQDYGVIDIQTNSYDCFIRLIQFLETNNIAYVHSVNESLPLKLQTNQHYKYFVGLCDSEKLLTLEKALNNKATLESSFKKTNKIKNIQL